MSALSKESSQLIDVVIAYLRVKENQQFYNQSTYGNICKDNPCETECCVAGVIDYIKSGPKNHYDRVNLYNGNGIQSIASSHLHLKDGSLADTTNLFNVGYSWIRPFGDDFQKAESKKDKVKVAIARLKHFKAYGK